MGEKSWNIEEIFDVFGDTLARRVLILASQEPRSAKELADQLDTSPQMIYRRVNTLSDYDLLKEDIQIVEGGKNHKTYETTLKQITLTLGSNGYNVDIELRQDLAHQFEAFWAELDQLRFEISLGSSSDSDRTSNMETDG